MADDHAKDSALSHELNKRVLELLNNSQVVAKRSIHQLIDAILGIYTNIVSGIVVYPNMIRQHIMNELPFMATENILMEAVKKGGDRQKLHEIIRKRSMEAVEVLRNGGS